MADRPILMSPAMVCALLDGRKTQTRRVIKPQPWIDERGNVCVEDTRRGQIMYGQHPDGSPQWENFARWRCPYGARGDQLWARETFAQPNDQVIIYRANWREDAQARGLDNIPADDSPIRWRPSIHMPRRASRLTLTITDVRVQQLQEISEAEAIAEGLYKSYPDDGDREWFHDHHLERFGAPPSTGEVADFEAGVWMVPGVPQGWGLTKEDRQRDQWGPTPQFCFQQLWSHINGVDSWDANPWVWALTFDVARRNIDAATP